VDNPVHPAEVEAHSKESKGLFSFREACRSFCAEHHVSLDVIIGD
jgi:hypothetical protein